MSDKTPCSNCRKKLRIHSLIAKGNDVYCRYCYVKLSTKIPHVWPIEDDQLEFKIGLKGNRRRVGKVK